MQLLADALGRKPVDQIVGAAGPKPTMKWIG